MEFAYSLLNKTIHAIYASRIDVHQGVVLIHDLILGIEVDDENLLLNASRFTEIEESTQIFYKFEWTSDNQQSPHHYRMQLNLPPVTVVEIYGVKIPKDELEDARLAGLMTKDQEYLVSVFRFVCGSQELLVVLHDILPRIEVYIDQTAIRDFWLRHRNYYHLLH